MSTLTSISPKSVAVNEPTQTLTVNGSGFVSGTSIITVAGAQQTTTFVSATKLTCSMNPGTLFSDVGGVAVGVSDAPGSQTLNVGPSSSTGGSGTMVKGPGNLDFYKIDSALVTVVGSVGKTGAYLTPP